MYPDSRRTLTVRDQGTHSRRPAVARGHDAILKALQDSGQATKLIMISGRVYKGAVVNRDRWTVTMRTAEDKAVTVYKHAIEAFIPQEAA